MQVINLYDYENDVKMLYEIRGVYDGWCFVELKDGAFLNRWGSDDYRYKAMQEAIEERKKYVEATKPL